MSNREEYKVRKERLRINPNFKNFKEGFWLSPCGTKIVDVLASYEASAVNISWREGYHSSVYPCVWRFIFDNWTHLKEGGEEKK